MDPSPGEGRLRVLEDAGTAGWDAVYREHVVRVYRFVFARTGNRPDAEDVTGQVFLRSLPRLRPAASSPEVRAYLLATARTVLADHWAARYGVPVDALDEERALLPLRAGDGDAGDGAGARVEAVLSRLPLTYRRVLELRFLRGLSVRETARDLALSVSNVKVLQHRALRRAAGLDGDAPAEGGR